ncbi:MAG: tRNA (N6-threonylcarbamoyladenosine(37)-N6)-methyltransferase TrmO [Bacteroidales bacterium]|nr:tRNA (N6-threonylcarbamoyladenosine(37)-N6)-methyltransferase TrmO [Bacteroidales bacterium]
MKAFTFNTIGIIHSPFDKNENVPIQPSSGTGIKGSAEIYPEYAGGLKDLDGFSHIMLLYCFHLSGAFQLEVKPFLDENKHGVFATRAPRRPNNIGISVVRLLKVDQNILHLENMDIINGTPLLDIKPYIPDFDAAENIRLGWLTGSKHRFSSQKADKRFDF